MKLISFYGDKFWANEEEWKDLDKHIIHISKTFAFSNLIILSGKVSIKMLLRVLARAKQEHFIGKILWLVNDEYLNNLPVKIEEIQTFNTISPENLKGLLK